MINKIISLGIKEILINTHYLPTQIENLVNKIQKSNDCEIKLVYEKNLLGTAGTLINNINFFEKDDCLLLHCDNYTTDDLKKFVLSKNSIIGRLKCLLLKLKIFHLVALLKLIKIIL